MFRLITLASSLLAAGLALAACGSSANDPAASASSNNRGPGSAIAFSRCMRANGVPNFPDPQGGGIKIQASQSAGSGQSMTVNGVPVSAPAFQSAQRKCQKYAPVGRAPSAQEVARLKAGALAMARCMRSHGVPNFPDPVVSTGPGGQGIGIRIGGGPGSRTDENSPAYHAAAKACQPLMGGPGLDLAGPGGSGKSVSPAG